MDSEALDLAKRFAVDVEDADPRFPSSKLFVPRERGPHPAILLLHGAGSEGGALTLFPAARLAQRGFVTLAFSYCGAAGTPAKLARIDLGRTVAAAEWLSSLEVVAPRRVGLLGWSRGAEQALIVASETTAPVGAVAAFAPTDVVYAAWDPVKEEVVRENGETVAAWLVRGEALPPHRAIRIEQFNGAVLLVAGEKDEVWPSAEAGRALNARLVAAGRPAELHVFPGEGHFLSWDASSIALDRTVALFKQTLR